LKSHEISKSEISRPNDFNSLRGYRTKRNRFASEIYQFASEISRQRKYVTGNGIHIEMRADRSRSWERLN
jgi:hypothetical protein